MKWFRDIKRGMMWALVQSPWTRMAYRRVVSLYAGFPYYVVSGPLAFFRPDVTYQTYMIQMADQFGLSGLYSRVKSVDATKKKFLPIKVRGFKYLNQPELMITPEIRRIARQDNMSLFFDISGEAIGYHSGSDHQLLAFHQNMERMGFDGDRIWLLHANGSTAEAYPAWADRHKLTYRIHMLGYNYYIFKVAREIARGAWMKKNRQALLSAAKRTVTHHEMRNSYFMSLNYKARTHRTVLLLHLLERGHMDKGIVTYFGDEEGIDTLSGQIESDVEKLALDLPQGEKLLAQRARLKEICPLSFERDSKEIVSVVYRSPSWSMDKLVPENCRTNTVERIESYFEIVTETYFTDSCNLYITEKIVRPIIRFQPFLHIGSPHAMAYLKSIGFKTFFPLIDDSYDTIDDPAKRMAAILHEIDKLCGMTKEDLHKAYCQLWPVLEHNYNHLLDHMPEVYKRELPAMLARMQ